MKPILPMIRQSETSECGLACVAMVAAYHGYNMDLAAIRRRHSTSLRGMTLENIVFVAQQLHLATRALRVDIEDLAELRTPCILHWEMTHFVVMRSVGKNAIIIHDPASGVRRVRMEEIDRCFTGIALELWASESFKTADEADPVTTREMLSSVSGLRTMLTKGLTLATLVELLALCSPVLFQQIVDHVILRHQAKLSMAVTGLLFFGLLEAFATLSRDLSTINIGTRLSLSWQTNLISHLVRLPVQYFEKRSTGDILSRFDASEVVRRTVTGSFTDVVLSGVVSVLTLVAMLFYSKMLSVIVLVCAAAYLGIRHIALGRQRAAASSQASNDAQLRTHLMETLHGIRSLKLFKQEAQRVSRWLNLLVDATNSRSKVEVLKVWVLAGSTILLRTEMVAVIGLGAWLSIRGKLSLGAFFAFLVYKDQFNLKVLALINSSYDLQTLSVHLNLIGDVVREEPESELSGVVELPDVENSLPATISFVSLYFRYSDYDPWIIENLTLTIQSGECVAIVGRSGAGKSTLLKLMCGLLIPTSGVVLIDGQPVAGRGRRNMQNIAMVLQDDCVFSGTIAENIHFFSENPDMVRIEESVKMSALEREIAAMPMGYETHIGTAGRGISGGQKQRLLIARALYRRPSLLIFDESTSHLDLTTEKMIASSLSELRVTRVMVAHRPETVAIADRVLAFEGTRLAQVQTKFREILPETEYYSRSDISLEKETEHYVRSQDQQSICTFPR
jgi:ATP-binding cassette subfamily B protein RaxB